MKRKVERISADLSQRLATLEGIEAITLAEAPSEEATDPYFLISLDVYHRGALPDSESRQRLFFDAGAFETSSVAAKDRFLIEGTPVRVEYKDVSRIEGILGKIERNLWVFRQTGTYMFYRLENGIILFKRSLWIEFVREELKALPDSFWELLRRASQATMEHYLSDLTAAVARGDPFFYVISHAGFVKSACSMLFVLNRRFEPSGRALAQHILELPRLPEHFKGSFDSLLREDPELTPARKREVAELLARSLIAMAATAPAA